MGAGVSGNQGKPSILAGAGRGRAFDAETDAASLQHDHSPPGKNSAVISIGRELRKLVERRGTTLHWVKVLGHSDDVINDRADELATVDGVNDGGLMERLGPDWPRWDAVMDALRTLQTAL